jgi:hypothetical protein
MGWFSGKDDKPQDDEKPWNKPLSDEAAKKLLEGLKKKDPAEKDQKNHPPKKGWW